MMKMKAFIIVGLVFACCFSEASAQELFKAPEGVKTRWASPENWEAAKGQGKVDFSRPRTFLLFERQDDYSSCAYFYLDKPENGLPALLPFNERIQ